MNAPGGGDAGVGAAGGGVGAAGGGGALLFGADANGLGAFVGAIGGGATGATGMTGATGATAPVSPNTNILVNDPGAGSTDGDTTAGGASEGAAGGATGGATGGGNSSSGAAAELAGSPTIKSLVKAPGPGSAATVAAGLVGNTCDADGAAGADAANASEAAEFDGVKTTGLPPLLSASHFEKDVPALKNSVTMAKPDAKVAVSITRFFSVSLKRSSCARRRPTSAGLAASATCTITTRPVVSACALCVRIPPSMSIHLSRRYRVLKSSLMIPKHLDGTSDTRQSDAITETRWYCTSVHVAPTTRNATLLLHGLAA